MAPIPRSCTHYSCRCARADELAAMGMLLDAIAVHHQRVLCRQPSDFGDARFTWVG